jgi:hypothetical protein
MPSIQWLLDKLFSFRAILSLAFIAVGLIILIHFKPLTIKYSECSVTENGFNLTGYEYRVATIVSKENGAVICLKKTITKKSNIATAQGISRN